MLGWATTTTLGPTPILGWNNLNARQDIDMFTRPTYRFGVGKGPVGKNPVVAKY